SDINGKVNTDINNISFSGSLPLVSSGSFENGTGDLHPTELGASKFNENITSTNIQGVNPEAYIESLNLLTNTDDYKFNILTAPGLNNEDHGTEVAKLASVATERQDCISVIDLVGYDTPIATVTTQASNFNNSYAATYWPWLQTQMDGKNAWVPPSTLIPGVYAFTDKSGAAWFAPAGLTRGAINANKAERRLTAGNRDTLYAANVNPIATFPGSGVVVFGQKTLQKGASALDRVNVRRLLIELKSYISQISDNLVFEQNSIATRNSFLTQVNPYLEGIQQRQGLYAFKVVMDETNNTAGVVDRNELVGQIYLQPTKTAEFILLDFNVTPTGATFPA
ncbi:phage tail sheath subtilisin-like domain-containing protein, partial [bacterium]|nr:phage tail sheath subtilisin-like domain-containing protein [bacterium]